MSRQSSASSDHSADGDRPPGVRQQCTHCPWRTDVDPFDIPNGYSVTKHAALSCTIADPGSLDGLAQALAGAPLQLMACHESPVGREQPCVGWLAHQIGPGNNLALRLAAIQGRIPPFQTVGEQHACLEDTLPRGDRAPRRAANRSSPSTAKRGANR